MQMVQLAHGSGGIQTQEFIEKVFEKYLGEFFISKREDAGVFMANGKFASSTDTYVVNPLFFSGGDIGKLSICGSSNDVLMMGAIPRYITIGFIIEEGLEVEVLERVLESMRSEIKKTQLKILSADTKVVEKGSVDKLFINTTAIGEVVEDISIQNLQEGDVIILSGSIGAHGGVIFCARNEVNLNSSLKSDCKQLYSMFAKVFSNHGLIHTMRDATRGGIASVLNEWCESCDMDILIDEESIPVSSEVQGICEILGLEPYVLANEGTCILAVAKKDAIRVLELLHMHEDGKEACIIGEICKKSSSNARVILKNAWGGMRFLDHPQGELLPRIC